MAPPRTLSLSFSCAAALPPPARASGVARTKLGFPRRRCGASEFFFNIAIFFSYFRTRHCLQVITEVGHLVIRWTREEGIVSGGHDIAPFEAGPRMPEHLSHPPDASGPKPATSSTFTCCRTRRLRQGSLRAAKMVDTPARHPTPLLARCFSLCSSQLQL
jgi:hypothetical protein